MYFTATVVFNMCIDPRAAESADLGACCCSAAQLCLTLCDHPGLQHTRLPCPPLSPRVCSNSRPLSVMPSNHLILSSLPSIFPSIRVFSNESALRIRWPKDWSFSIRPSNEYSGLISVRGFVRGTHSQPPLQTS